jgi:hypothetical protein
VRLVVFILVMSSVTSRVISTGDAAGNHTGSFTGDVDVRGHTVLFDDGQIQEAALNPEILVNRGVPLGAIMMWAGIVADIPESWHLCDGNGGTPDLRNRFIIGAGVGSGTLDPGANGGADSLTLTGAIANSGAHTHPLEIDGHALSIAELPAHAHLNGIGDDLTRLFTRGTGAAATANPYTIKDESGFGAHYEGETESIGGGAEHTHTGNTANSGAHSHDLTLDDISILPPYYALCYIMKIV